MPEYSYSQPERALISQQDASISPSPSIPRARFINQWNRKTTFDAGKLIPILVDEVLPGDHVNIRVTAYVRMSTPLFPMMDSQRIDTFFFFVPNRILWSNWEKFQGFQEAPGDSIAFLIPQVIYDAGGFVGAATPPNEVGTLGDYFGIPTQDATVPANAQVPVTNVLRVNALPFRAYNRIWSDWFRDQNINPVVVHQTGDGPDSPGSYGVRLRAKSHDYFTSALPWPQKFPSPGVPISGFGVLAAGVAGPLAVIETGGDIVNYDFYQTSGRFEMNSAAVGSSPMLYAEVNAIRDAFAVQTLTERAARGGTRYVETLWAQWRVRNPDYRLQRAEYIGGGQSPMDVTPVAQTAPAGLIPVGALGAASTGAGQHMASYAATEHGFIIGLINIKSELSYQQGLHKMWSRRTAADMYVPAMAGLGEQAILRKELYVLGEVAGVPGDDELVFGYQERWQEYRTRTSEVTGYFRSSAGTTLDMWHLSQHFLTPPVLSTAFIAEDPPMGRVLAAGLLAVNQQYLADLLFDRTITRLMPTHGVPAGLGRF